MNYSAEELIRYIEEEDVKFIRLAFRDAFGVQKNISVMPGEMGKAFDGGIPIHAREIAGFEDSPHAWLYLRPDPQTGAVLPWRPDNGRVLRLFCDVYTQDGEEYIPDTRNILKRAVQLAAQKGIEFRFGNETEFYLFRKDDDGSTTQIPYDEAGYLDIAPLDRCENVRREICLTIEQMGLTPERSYHERGPGQNEIDFHYARPIKAADQMTTFRMAVCTIADRNGLTADFSPLPLPGKPGNGYHINIYVVDSNGDDVARYAAAGIMEVIREITLFLNPSNASYARLGSSSAPDRVDWSSAGGSELLHMGSYTGKPSVELRSPDAGCNPYLVYALLIHAGLSGIERRLSLPQETLGSALYLPTSRKEAVKLACRSTFVREIVPEGILKAYAGEGK